MELKTVYFDNPGKENTDEVLRIARQRAEELGIKTVVVATTVGDTAAMAVDVFEGMKVVLEPWIVGGFSKVGFFLTDDGAVVEFMQYLNKDKEWFPEDGAAKA